MFVLQAREDVRSKMDYVSNVSQSKKQYIQVTHQGQADSLDDSDLPIIINFEKQKQKETFKHLLLVT